ncbi:MAG TPA: hypothetical protein VH330_05265 [Candidatus Udaeobacter sp.]|jgi:hypothetical protein
MTDENKHASSSAENTSSANTGRAGTEIGDIQGVGVIARAAKVKPGTGPGDKDVGTIGIVVLTFYLIAAILLCFYGLIALWPGPSPSGQVPPGKAAVSPTPTLQVTPSSVSRTETSSAESAPVITPAPGLQATRGPITIFGRQLEIWDEVRLLLIVILAGALGSLVHTVRSVYWYIGNRTLKWSWLAKYILQPFAGSALSVIFYVVVRGGFFSPQTTFANTSPFGFAALAALVGLFSEQAVLKLKTVAETVLERPSPGADATQQDEDSLGSPDDDKRA